MAEMLCLEMIKTIFVPYFPGIDIPAKESLFARFIQTMSVCSIGHCSLAT